MVKNAEAETSLLPPGALPRMTSAGSPEEQVAALLEMIDVTSEAGCHRVHDFVNFLASWLNRVLPEAQAVVYVGGCKNCFFAKSSVFLAFSVCVLVFTIDYRC